MSNITPGETVIEIHYLVESCSLHGMWLVVFAGAYPGTFHGLEAAKSRAEQALKDEADGEPKRVRIVQVTRTVLPWAPTP